MFTPYKDYVVVNAHIPVLTLQDNGEYVAKDCYFLEFIVNQNYETNQNIKAICEPFEFIDFVQYTLLKLKYFPNASPRLFILGAPESIRHNFFVMDELLAMTLCADHEQRTSIQCFEVNYKFRHNYNPNQKYKNVGTSMLSALKQNYQNRELYGRSVLDAVNFWLKNDFTRLDDREQHLHWHQNKTR